MTMAVFAHVTILQRIILEACNFIEKEASAQVFSCEFCEISKNTFFTENVWTTDSLFRNFSKIVSEI